MKPNKCLSSQSPIVVVVKFTHSSINLQEDRQQGNAPRKTRVKYAVCLSPIGSINSLLMAKLRVENAEYISHRQFSKTPLFSVCFSRELRI